MLRLVRRLSVARLHTVSRQRLIFRESRGIADRTIAMDLDKTREASSEILSIRWAVEPGALQSTR